MTGVQTCALPIFLFSLRDGEGGVGNVPLITPWAAAGAGAQTARPPQEQPQGAAQTPSPSLLSGIRSRPVFLVQQTVRPAHGVLSLSCRHSVGKPQAGPLRMQIREMATFLCSGHLHRRAARFARASWEPGDGSYLPGAGAWGFPPKLQQNPAHATTFPPSVCPAFQLNPNYKWV